VTDQPEAVERGRYAAFPQPDGAQGLMIYRATGLCQTCRDCQCGDQQEPIDLSVKGMLSMRAQLGKLKKGALPV
jgi:hypothetical protein